MRRLPWIFALAATACATRSDATTGRAPQNERPDRAAEVQPQSSAAPESSAAPASSDAMAADTTPSRAASTDEPWPPHTFYEPLGLPRSLFAGPQVSATAEEIEAATRLARTETGRADLEVVRSGHVAWNNSLMGCAYEEKRPNAKRFYRGVQVILRAGERFIYVHGTSPPGLRVCTPQAQHRHPDDA